MEARMLCYFRHLEDVFDEAVFLRRHSARSW
jgi:hypothetical protein